MRREGGGPIQEFYEEVFGVDLYANFFMSMCGIPIDPPRSETPLKSFGFYFVNCPNTGTLLKNDFLEAAAKHPLVTSTECMGHLSGSLSSKPPEMSQYDSRGAYWEIFGLS